jgi:hypothetical protein
LTASQAGGTESKQKDFVPLGNKALRNGRLLLQGTARHLEEAITGTAVKKVVMFLLGPFIQRARFRVANDPEPAFFHEQLQIAVNGRLVQGLYGASSKLENFFNPQRSTLLEEDFLDRVSLNGFSPHLKSSLRVKDNLLMLLMQLYLQ